jgi:hypothetical protein
MITLFLIVQIASQSTAFEFWLRRDNITQQIQTLTDERLQDFHGKINIFTLNNFELPQAFAAALSETEAAAQEIPKVSFEVRSAQTQAQTQIEASLQDAKVIRVQAEATARSILLNANATVTQIKNTVESERIGYKALKETLQFSNDELAAYLWIEGLRQSTRTQATLHLERPANLQI